MEQNDVQVTRASDGAPATQQEKNDVAARKLREAAKLVETALILLDTYSEPCGGCGARHFRNLTHANVYQKLTDTPHRLRTCADDVEKSDEKNAKHNNRRRRHGRG